MAEELQKVHLYYDDINKIRVIESQVLKETEDLKETCKDYETSEYLIKSSYIRNSYTEAQFRARWHRREGARPSATARGRIRPSRNFTRKVVCAAGVVAKVC